LSETNRLGINITATDQASATMRQLAAQARALENEIQRAKAAGLDQSGAYAAALGKPLAQIREQIAAIQQQQEAIKKATAAINEQTAALAKTESVLERINRLTGADPTRVFTNATESAKTLAQALSAAAEADDRLRQGVVYTAKALREASVEAAYINRNMEMAAAHVRAQANYENRDRDLATAKTRGEATYENRDFDLARRQTRGEAEYQNRDVDLAANKARAEAEYENATKDAIANKARAEAEYTNKTIDAVAAKARAEAEYENKIKDAIADKARAEAEYSNKTIDAVAAKARAEAEYDNKTKDAQAAKARAEAEYINKTKDAISNKERAEAEYINSTKDAEAAKARAQAEYENKNRELISQKQRAEAEYENTAINAANEQARKEAEYTNNTIDLIRQKQRAEAEYINEAIEGFAKKARAEAEYTNQQIDLIRAKQRAEAEYINTNMEAAKASQRAEANYINTDADLIAARQRQEAFYINRDLDLQEAKRRAELRAAMKAEDEAYIADRKLAEYMNNDLAIQERMRLKTAGSSMPELRHGVALFDELSRGQRGAMFGTLGAMARDAGVGVAALGTSIAGLMAIMAGGAILHGAESMGKWAEETRAAASAAGMSIQNYSALQGALTLTGVKAESANASLRHVAESLSQALADPASRAAEAFHNLGISQDQLNSTGGDVGKLLNLLADAFVRTADGAGKSAAMEQIAGRGFENLIPALQGGSRELKALEEKAESLGLTLTDKTAAKLIETGEGVKKLGEEIHGHAIQAFQDWAPTIDAVTTSLGRLLNIALSVTGAIGRAVTAVAEASGKMISEQTESGFQPSMYGDIIPIMPAAKSVPSGPGRSPTGPAPVAKTVVPPMSTPISALEQMRQDMTTAAFAASQSGGSRSDLQQKETQAEIDAMQNTLATTKLTDNERAQISSELNQKRTQLANETASAEGTAAKQSYQDFAANERLKVTEAQGSGTKIVAIYDEWLKAAETRFAQSAATIAAIEREKVQAINTARLQEIKEGARREEEENRTRIVMGQAQAISSGTMGYAGQKGSTTAPGEGTQALAAQAQGIEAAMQAEVASLTQVMNTATKGSDTQRAAAEQIQSVVTNAKTQEIALYNKAAQASIEAANKAAAPFNKFFDTLGNAFQSLEDTIIKALIAPQRELIKQGLTTIKRPMEGNEIRQAGSKALMGVVTDFAQSLQNTLTQTLAKSLSGGATNSLTSLLSTKLMSLLNVGTSAATQAPQAASFGLSATALTTAGTSLTSAGAVLDSGAITLSAAATTLMTAASTMLASGGGGGASGLISFLPELAEFSGGGIVPSAAGGMVVGGIGSTLAILHQKEMVLPQHLSTGIQQMINRGGDTTTSSANANLNYSPTINTASRSRNGTGMTRSEFGQMLSLHSGAMLGEARNMMRSGWRPA